ncbi:glutamic acid-rich protein [Helicoverpa armigera]|uniref:glutamic acid-rich protein n=1 Tax=Helicoverpa armigera TaxID=29058 RepID=UPI003082EB94
MRKMADDKYVDNSPRSSNVDSLIEKLRVEISNDSEDDFMNTRRLTIQSTANRADMTNETTHDIDKEITELENLIKRLQAEIVEMTESASKPLNEYYPDDALNEENSFIIRDQDQGERHLSPLVKNDINDENDFKIRKHGSDVIFPVILKDNGLLNEQEKLFAENMSNPPTIVSKDADTDNEAIDGVRRNFSVLWDDTPNSNDTNSMPNPIISEMQPKPLIDPALEQAIPVGDLKFVSNISKPPDKTTTMIAQVEPTTNIDKIHDDDDEEAAKNFDEDHNQDIENTNSSPTANDDISKIETSSFSSLSVNDNISKIETLSLSEIVNEHGSEDLPVTLNNEAIIQSDHVKTLPGGAENLTTVTTDPKIADSNRSPSSESKKSILKLSKKDLHAAPPSNTAEQIISTILPKENPNTNQEATKTPAKPVSKSESNDSGIMKTVNKKLRKLVGKVSKASIDSNKNETKTQNSSTSDSDMSKKNRKSASKAKSKDSLTQDEKGKNKTIHESKSSTNNKETATVKPHRSSNSAHKSSHKTGKVKSKSSLSQSSVDNPNSRNESESKIKAIKSKSIKSLNSAKDLITKVVTKHVENKDNIAKENVLNTVNTKIPINATEGPQIVDTENIFAKSEINSTQIPITVTKAVSNADVIPKTYSGLTEDSIADSKDESAKLEAAKEVTTMIVTEDFGSNAVEEDLEGEEDLMDEEDLPNDNDSTPGDEQEDEMLDCVDDDDEENPYDVD